MLLCGHLLQGGCTAKDKIKSKRNGLAVQCGILCSTPVQKKGSNCVVVLCCSILAVTSVSDVTP